MERTFETMMHSWRERRSGPEHSRPHSEFREPYIRDRARVIHTAAFRRLQAKTQVLGIGEGDFHRTRLTHSMEVAQVSRGIVRWLSEKDGKAARKTAWGRWLPSPNVIETVALAHDLGHPPFGHGGEIALNFVMRDFGGFEGNGQTLRLLSRLEAHTEGFGLDLTRRSLLGVLKYPVPYESVVRRTLPAAPSTLAQLKRDHWKPPKCYFNCEKEVVNWMLLPFSREDRRRFTSLKKAPTAKENGKSKYRAFDTSILELGDDIAYGVHDFEDAIALRLIHKEEWLHVARKISPKWGRQLQLLPVPKITRQLFDGTGDDRKQAIGQLVNALIVSAEVFEDKDFEHPMLRFQTRLLNPASLFLECLKDLVVDKVIKTPQVQTLEYRGQQLVLRLYEAIDSDPRRLLKDSFAKLYQSAANRLAQKRIVCDYIAGMTDEYATRMYERLFVPRQGHVFDRL